MSECSVCLEDVELSNPESVVLPCNHVFHSHCIEDWRNQQPQQQEVTCPNCRHGVQQESMQELIRPFEYLDLILIPMMLLVWICQGVFITFPQIVAAKVALVYTWLCNLPYRQLLPLLRAFVLRELTDAWIMITTAALRCYEAVLFIVIVPLCASVAQIARSIASKLSGLLGFTGHLLAVTWTRFVISPLRAVRNWIRYLLVDLVWGTIVFAILLWVSAAYFRAYYYVWAKVHAALHAVNAAFQRGISMLEFLIVGIIWGRVVHPVIRRAVQLVEGFFFVLSQMVTGISNFIYFWVETGCLIIYRVLSMAWDSIMRKAAKVAEITLAAYEKIATFFTAIWQIVQSVLNYLEAVVEYLWETLKAIAHFVLLPFDWLADKIHRSIMFVAHLIAAAYQAVLDSILYVRQTITWLVNILWRPFVLLGEFWGDIRRRFAAWWAAESRLGIWIKQQLHRFFNFCSETTSLFVGTITYYAFLGVTIIREAIFFFLYTWVWAGIVSPVLDLFIEECVLIADFAVLVGSLSFLLLGYLYDTACSAVYSAISFVGNCVYAVWMFIVNTMVNPVCSLVSSAVRSISNYSMWIATVSANALVALAQLGWTWIKVRIVKGYHFFKIPIVRMASLVKAAVFGAWGLTKSLAASIVAVSRYISSATKAVLLSMLRAVKDMVNRRVVAPVKAIVANIVEKYRLMKRAVVGLFNLVKMRIVEHWRLVQQTIVAVWRRLVGTWLLTKQVVGDRWRSAKQRVVLAWLSVKRSVGDRWGAVKQRLVGSWAIVKQSVGDRWGLMKQIVGDRWGTLKQSVGDRWRVVTLRIGATWGAMKQRVLAVVIFAKAKVYGVKAQVKAVKASTLQEWNRILEQFKQRWNYAKLQLALYKALMKARTSELKERARATWYRGDAP